MPSSYLPASDPSLIAVASPLEIAGCKLWLRAEDLALNDADAIASWTDLSGNANHALQATGGNKPLFKAGILNGFAVARFDGTDDYLATAAGIITDTGARSLFVVYRILDLSGGNIRIICGEGSVASANRTFYMTDRGDQTGGGPAFAGFAGGDLASGLPINWPFWKIASVSWAGGTSGLVRLFVGPALVATANSTLTVTTTGFQVGRSGAESFFHKGDIAEVIYYDTQLSIASHMKVVRYLQERYRIY